MSSPFEAELRRIVREEVRAGLEEARSAQPGWVDQGDSPLGRRHCAIVRRRAARGESGTAIVGRRHLLSAEALSEELGRVSGQLRGIAAPSTASEGVRLELELERELRVVRGGRGG